MGALIMVGALAGLAVLIVGLIVYLDPEARDRPVSARAKRRQRQ